MRSEEEEDGAQAGVASCEEGEEGEVGAVLEKEKNQPHQRVALIFVGVRPLCVRRWDIGHDERRNQPRENVRHRQEINQQSAEMVYTVS